MSPRPTSRLVRSLIALLAMALLAVIMSAARAQSPLPRDEPPPTGDDGDLTPGTLDLPPRTGAYRITFTQRHPGSAISRIKARMRYATTEPAPEYDIEDESFEVYVPSDYDPARAYGLIVWSSPSESAAAPPQWLPVLDRRDFIWVGANGAGNERIGWYRFGLALDAAHNMRQTYNIDPLRLYIAGMSGGGRIASRLGVAYADEFAGAFMIVGCDFYRRTPVPDQPGKVYIERYQPPPGPVLARAVRDNRYVLLTGSEDFNRTETATIYEHGFVKERFAHATYLEVPDMGHTLPDAEWFDKGLEALDAPLAERRAAEAEAMEKIEREAADALVLALEKFDADAVAGYELLEAVADRFAQTAAGRTARLKAAQWAADPANKAALDAARVRDQARQLLSMVDNYIKAGRPDLAREKLKQVIALVPDTDLAREAAQRLEALKK
ncbi:MAG: hypothetical protein IT430_03610 [Phycisphaerales bacterium]|nr:hypothetical protein [Phycisphaerales bacterium]